MQIVDILKTIIGFTEQNTIEFVTSHGLKYRVSSRDGLSLVLTRDFNRNRINVNIVGGIVISSNIG
jgi:hypothetical protein